jgi:transcriptional regulator with AAA-type ATPase domain
VRRALVRLVNSAGLSVEGLASAEELQEQDFERLGSGKTHRINVRLIAATHRDLTEMVRRKEFRNLVKTKIEG